MNVRTLKKHREPVADCPQPDSRELDWLDGSRECFCDTFAAVSDPRHTCGDCPRDYVWRAWDARRNFLDRDFLNRPHGQFGRAK